MLFDSSTLLTYLLTYFCLSERGTYADFGGNYSNASTRSLVNVALLLTVLTLRAWHWCLPPGELHSPGHCIHSMHYEHKLKEGVCARSGREAPRALRSLRIDLRLPAPSPPPFGVPFEAALFAACASVAAFAAAVAFALAFACLACMLFMRAARSVFRCPRLRLDASGLWAAHACHTSLGCPCLP